MAMGLDKQQEIQDKVNEIIKQAQQSIASGDQHNAVLLLDQVLSQHPDHPDANYQSALIDLEIKGSEQALKKFEKAVTNKPQNESHWIGYIKTLMESASLEIVLEALELGQQYALTSKQAKDLAEKFLSKCDENLNHDLRVSAKDSQETPQQHVDKNIGELRTELANEANQAIEQAKASSHTQLESLSSDSLVREIQSLLDNALEAHQNQDIDQAIKGYLAVLKLDDKHPEANHNLGVIETHTQSAEVALPRFEVAVQACPKSEQFWVSYIDALIMSGAHDTALQAIDYAKKSVLSEETVSTLMKDVNEQKSLTHPAAQYLKLLDNQQNNQPPTESIYLHLGCGDRKFEGFINIDSEASADMQLDLTEPLPWAQSSVDGIYSEHFFEHITQAQGIALLHEARRLLKPGGVIRIAMPDLEAMVKEYNNHEINPEWGRLGVDWAANRCERLNMAMRWWGRQWIYDQEELVRLAKKIGLSFKGRYQYGESDVPMFKNKEHRASSDLIIEFEKPNRRLAADSEPLVTVAIPAYNPEFFLEALETAINQTYANIEILVCDDCETAQIKTIVDQYQQANQNIRYIKNSPNLPDDHPPDYGRTNYILCLQEAKGEFIKYLNDDDLLEHSCVEKMVDCFKNYDELVMVTSERLRITANTEVLPHEPATLPPVSQTSLIEGLSLGNALLKTKLNFVGEPSTVMFRREDLIDNLPDMFSVDAKQYHSLADVLIFQHLLPKGNVVYITQKLSAFRRHSSQTQVMHQLEMVERDYDTWAAIEFSWKRFGFLK